MQRTPPVVIVFGAHITALAVMRAFGRARIPVYVAGRNRTTIKRSRWYRPVPVEDIDESADVERLVRFLRSLPFERTVLFPCSDRWTLSLASLPDEVAAVHVPVAARPEVVRTLIDKQCFADATTAHDVPAPRVLRPAQLAAIPDSELHLFFIKPRNSQAFTDRFGGKALQIHGRAHASQLLRELADASIDVMLQEFIPGPPTAHIFLDGYVDRSGTMRACLARRRMRMYPRPFGNSTLSVTIAPADAAGAIDALRKLFEGLGYVGLFDAEFKFDERDRRFKILEVNGRPWWQLELMAASGLDVCMMAYRDAIGEPVTTIAEYGIGKTWVNPVPDLTAWWMGVNQGDRTGGFPIRTWFTGPNTICSWDDPLPAIDELARFFRIVTRRRKGRTDAGPADASATGDSPVAGR